jgi:ABC-type sugar transport system ATPase subunit
MSVIELRNLTKSYDNGFVAVDRVSLTIGEGEFLVLVGPSGCGKSTTLRMIAGLEEVSQGDLMIDGSRVNDLEPGDRDIAMVFQNYALYPHKSVRENLAFGLRMRRTPADEIDRRIEEVSEMLSIGELLDRRPRQLSGGQRQRVAVGRALVRKPKAFLFDEPLSNLDAKLRVQMRTELLRLHDTLKTTTVYVTHDQVEAMTLGQRIVVMKDGRVQQAASPLEIYRFPSNRFVAGFIGSPAMNMFEGRIDRCSFGATGISYPLVAEDPRLDPTPLAELQSQACTLGFRPEDVTFDPSYPKLGEAKVQLVERMGFETVVHFVIGQQHGIARLNGDREISSGQYLNVHLAPESWHLFAADESGCRLLSGASVPH